MFWLKNISRKSDMWLKKETIMNTFLRHHIKTFKYPFWNHIHELNILYYIKAYLSILHFEQIFYLYVILINTSKWITQSWKFKENNWQYSSSVLRQSLAKPKVYTHCDVMIWFLADRQWVVGRGKQGITTCSFHKMVHWVLWYLPNVGAHMWYQKSHPLL